RYPRRCSATPETHGDVVKPGRMTGSSHGLDGETGLLIPVMTDWSADPWFATTRVGRTPRGRNPSIRVQIPASPLHVHGTSEKNRQAPKPNARVQSEGAH